MYVLLIESDLENYLILLGFVMRQQKTAGRGLI